MIFITTKAIFTLFCFKIRFMQETTMFDLTINALDFDKGSYLRSTNSMFNANSDISELSEWLVLEKARKMNVHYVYFRRFDNRSSIPQFFVFDFTNKKTPSPHDLGKIQSDVWTSGDVLATFIFTKDSLTILNTSKPPVREKKNLHPVYLLKNAQAINAEIRQRFSAIIFDTGSFSENEAIHLGYTDSAHNKLLEKLRTVRSQLKNESKLEDDLIINRLLMQCILVRYLEDRKEKDEQGNWHTVFPENYFSKFNNSTDFKDVLLKGECINVFDDLNIDHFNGKIFDWGTEQRESLKKINYKELVKLLYDTDIENTGQKAFWNLYSFRYLPVEIISSIYEELFSNKKSIDDDGMVYTPAHLASFLIDEAMPLNNPKTDFRLLDPACGSGVFLVLGFKRLVQWWRILNQGIRPTTEQLTAILEHGVFGVDKEEGAVELAKFSLCLALCDMLSPYKIWHELKFPPLNEKNLINSDFFRWFVKTEKESFDLVIGNPPFSRGHKQAEEWAKHRKTHKKFPIPGNQIALHFLDGAIELTRRTSGLICLLLKSGSFLYGSTSSKYRHNLFNTYKVHQIIDFTPLARNNVLWNKADVDACAVFIQREEPELEQSILHLIVRRTLNNTLKRTFEIDTYDFNWVAYPAALKDDFVWKCNLLGGGRLYQVVKALKNFPTLKNYLDLKKWTRSEGQNANAELNNRSGNFVTDKHILPTDWLGENGVKSHNFPMKTDSFLDKSIYSPPHIVIKGGIGNIDKIPMDFLDQYVMFKDKIIGIQAPLSERDDLLQLYNNLKNRNNLYRAIIFATSGECLVGRNTALQVADFDNLPYPINNEVIELSLIEQYLFNDVLDYYQWFLRNPETSKAVKPIQQSDFNERIQQYHDIFCTILNSVYKRNENLFRPALPYYTEGERFIVIGFKYSTNNQSNIKEDEFDNSSFDNLMIHEQGNARFQRIIRIYKNNTVYFIKPNQYRYWLNSIAIRDADTVLYDLMQNGH